jgi:hypothetical protein
MELSLPHRVNMQAHTGQMPVMRLSWTHRWQAPGHTAAPARAVPFAAHEIREELDAIASTIRSGAVEAGVRRLRGFLDDRGHRMWPGGWHVLARSVREHPVLDFIHESPVAHRVFKSGPADAVDLFCETENLPPGTTARGRRIALCELKGDTPCGLRAGRDLIARAVDDLAIERPLARILAVDSPRFSGHRTADALCGIDLIHSAGLYEHLSDSAATTLTTNLFAMLASRGHLLVANMSPDATDRAYLEACMDWWMACRGESAMRRLVAAVPRDELASSRTFRDRTGHVVLLELIRA